MKKFFGTGFFVACCISAFSQPGKPVVAKPVPPIFKNINDSASYAVGVSVANFYKQQGITKLNTNLVIRGINDIFGNKKPLMDDQQCNSIMNTYMTRMQAEKSRPRIDSGINFLAKNKTKPGVKVTASGLQYEVITEGTGPKPTAADSVTCHYKGALLNGTVFDNSYDRGQPITFSLGGVIPGWTEGLQLMAEGSKYKLFIPYTLGYGAMDYGPIPGGSVLIFEVELLKVTKKQE